MLVVGRGKEEAKEPNKVIPETVEQITTAYTKKLFGLLQIASFSQKKMILMEC